MSQGLSKTKRRIKAIEGTEKITKSMELIATAKVKRFLDENDRVAVYFKALDRLLSRLLKRLKELDISLPLTEEGSGDKDLYIVFSSDLGLCGGYNSELFAFAASTIPDDALIAPIGSKGRRRYERGGLDNLVLDYANLPLNSLRYEKVDEIAEELLGKFKEGQYKNIYLVRTEYKNSISFKPRVDRLFPLSMLEEEEVDETYQCPPLLDDDPGKMLDALLPLYSSFWLYSKFVDSQLAEQASRRAAMDGANDNADKLLEKLRIDYNKARQNAITQEITEVVAGS